MSKKRIEITEIIIFLTRWMAEIELSNALTYYDVNKVSEGTIMKLLNLVFDYNLLNLNEIKVNFPGIDLGDEEKGIAIQVTSQKTAKKIKDSLDKFYENDLDKIYLNGLKVFIFSLPAKKAYKFEGYDHIFNRNEDIITFSDLIKEIEKIYDHDFPKFTIIYDLLNKEFGDQGRVTLKSVLVFSDISSKLDFYSTTFKKMYEADFVGFFPSSCHFNNNKINAVDFINENLVAEKIVIVGKSGLGKSMLSKGFGLKTLDRGGVPLFFEAKYFDDNIESLIYNDIKILGYENVDLFLQDCRRINKKIFLIVDGLNECDDIKKAKLIVQLIEIHKQHGVNLIISTQKYDATLDDVGASVLSIDIPTLETKIAIAGNNGAVNESVESMLITAETNYEAAMIGSLNLQILENTGRFNLLELYVRKKLNNNIDCLPFLSTLAAFLSENISFTISQRQIEDILLKIGVDKNILQKCLKSGLLKQSLNQFSFSHEIFLNFFVAESVSRFSKNSGDFIYQLTLPKNDPIQILILGGLENRIMFKDVFDSITSSKLIVDIVMGECGVLAKEWGESKLEYVMLKMEKECKNIKFTFSNADYSQINVVPESLLEWTSQEQAFALAIPEFISNGLLLNEFFKVVGLMDQTITNPGNLFSENEKKFTFGDYFKIFSLCYSGFSNDPKPRPIINHLFINFRSGIFSLYNEKKISSEDIAELIKGGNISNGQFYLLLFLCKLDDTLKLLFPKIIEALKNWKQCPPLLTSEIIYVAPFCYSNNEERLEIIEHLQTVHRNTMNAFTSTMLFDALSGLGTLNDDEEAYEETVIVQLQNIILKIDNEESCKEAYHIYYCQFDHPYSNAFFLAISKLSESETEVFYKMCLKGMNPDLFSVCLLIDSEKILKEKCCHFLDRFFNHPISNSTVPHDALKSCLLAYIILGIYNFPLFKTESSEINEEDNVIHLCGQLFYWLNRSDLEIEERKQNCEQVVDLLFDEKQIFVIDALSEVHHALIDYSINERFPNDSLVTIYEQYKNKILPIARGFLSNIIKQKNIFNFGRKDDTMKQAISLVERFGNSNDVNLLFELSMHDNYGVAAVKAIKKLSINNLR